jgi:hypothetical protein
LGLGDDQDGLVAALEDDAGLNPCASDTDGDGCNDAAEYYLRGCDDARNAVLEPRCYVNETQAEVRYVLPVGAGPWGRVSLRLPPEPQLRVFALEAAPSGAGARNGAEFLNVQAGATLRFEIVLQSPRGQATLTRGKIQVLADGQPVGAGKLLIMPLPECPIVI